MANQFVKLIITLGSINAMLAVILGAFGAHALRQRLSAQMLEVFQTGVQYHFYHALGLVLVGLLATQFPAGGVRISAWLMLAGIVLFSGSLYLLALSGIRQLGMITPLGGLCFIMAWGILTVVIIRS